jgi:hypothetical protein
VKLDLQSERFAPTGNLSGAGITKSLGAPTLNKLRVLVREACQNAWDARTGGGTVNVRFHLRRLSAREGQALGEALKARPSGGETRLALDVALGRDETWVLEISDRGTRGLSGPVRADSTEYADHGDFVSFFRDIGSPRDQKHGGGTYGYGKSSLYSLSRCHTIIAYSQTVDGPKPATRLMVAAIGHPYRHDGVRHTGRHWWGKRESYSRIVDPLQEDPAHRLAVALGLERRSSADTGTSIVVLDPDMGQRTPEQTANSIAECLVWFFWPKMLPRPDGTPAMQFELLLNGRSIGLPAPHEFAPLGIFVEAMLAAKSNAAPGFRQIRCERPIKDLGCLGLAKGPRKSRQELDTGEEEPLIPEHSSHIALMRPAELVVKYLQLPALPSDMVEFGGVFICDDDVEQYFADSEPPAHDDWLPASLSEPGKRFVRVALRRVKDAAEIYAHPAPGTGSRPEQASLAKVGDLLGSVLIGQDGGGPGRPESPPRQPGKGKSTPSKTLKISEPESFRFAIVKRVPCALFQVRLDIPKDAVVRLHAEALVVMEGGSTAPAEPGEARVIGWLDASGTTLTDGPDVTFSQPGACSTLIAVSVTPECAVSVVVSVTDGGK